MTQNSQTLSSHLQQMKVEMELCGLSPETLRHYLGHIKLLGKYFGKLATEVSPDEIKHYLYYRISAGISYSNV